MCRLFGFRSVIASQVHRSLVDCENALVHQSERHPDGWGVAYYIRDVPHVIKSVQTAVEDSLFARVSGIVSAQTVVAHLRKATAGRISMVNCHPFQYGHWIFAHNGQIPDFEAHRAELLGHVAPDLRRFVLGDTDSEVLFYMLLSAMAGRVDLSDQDPPLDHLIEAIDETVARVHEITGEVCYDSTGKDDLYLSFLLTNGQAMVGHQGGKPLFYSTHKTRCPERDTCPSFGRVCEMAVDSGTVNHLILTSEPLHGDNIWREMACGQIVGVDRHMELRIHREAAPVAASATI
jgi:glutamine amidotransferase